MKISHIMLISKLTSLCAIKQKIINTFADIAYNVLLVRNLFEIKWQIHFKI